MDAADRSEPGARSAKHRELRKQQIVDAAYDLIDEIGPRAFSMRKLAQKLDMSPMGAYGYFSSKNELLIACFTKLYEQVDNRPVPGELWDDTMQRVCGSLHDVMNEHYRVREIRDVVPAKMLPQTHHKRIYLLHMDQGMPEGVFRGLYLALSLYMESFFRREAIQNARRHAGQKEALPSDEPWERATALVYDEATFREGVKWITDSARSYRAPDPCEWRTPEDPADWTWEE